MNPEVTCILTSCGRFDLLRITLESFFKHNTYDVKEFIIYEDSRIEMPDDITDSYQFIRILQRQWGKKSQIDALDTLWSQVETPYAMTLEDDWEFLRPGFIEASMKVLEAPANKDILQCWLTGLEPLNQHPVIQFNSEYSILKSEPNLWSGTRFNPALKRKADYDLIAPFSQHTEWNPAKPWKSEADISKVYHKLGFKGAMLKDTYIKHIGGHAHVGP